MKKTVKEEKKSIYFIYFSLLIHVCYLASQVYIVAYHVYPILTLSLDRVV